MVPFSPASPA